MEYPLTQSEFRQIFAKVPRLCVDLIIKKGSAVLLTKRKISPYKGLWHLPGGTVYHGETIDQAVSRVAKSELGLKVLTKKLITYIEFSDEYKEDWHGWPVSLAFELTVEGDPVGSDQADELDFFFEIPTNTVDSHLKFLKSYLSTH